MALLCVAGATAEERTDASGQWQYELVGGGAMIIRSLEIIDFEEAPDVEFYIPSELDGYPVTGVGAEAFDDCFLGGGVVIFPAGITNIGEGAITDYGGCDYTTMAVTKGSAAEQYAKDNGIAYFVIDATGQWKYTVFDESRWWEALDFYPNRWPEDTLRIGEATIVGFVQAPSGDLLIPSEVDGYPVTGIRNWVYECPCDSEPDLPSYHALTGVTIPPGVTHIGYGAFWECENLSVVNIPDSVTHIDEYAFWRCGITSITIPASVNQIAWNPFVGSALTRFDVSPLNPVYEQINGVLFDKQQKTLVSYPSAKKGPYVIPEGVTSIGERAFYECSGITNLTIPASFDSIEWNPFVGGAISGFDVSLDSSIYEQIDGVLFDKQQKALVSYPGAREGSYVIPDGVTGIGSLAFYECGGITTVTIPGSVTTIGWAAFEDCDTVVLHVQPGSYAEEYAKRERIAYVYSE